MVVARVGNDVQDIQGFTDIYKNIHKYTRV